MYKSYSSNKSRTNQTSASQCPKSSSQVLNLENRNLSTVRMSDVKIHYSPTRPVQLRSGSGDVIQLAKHISNIDPVDNSTDISVIPSIKPTMVFESMGTSESVMDHVYEETKKYKGNTVCVFGLNQKEGAGPALNKGADRFEKPHNLVNFSFEWTKPYGMDASKGYEMPFVEARHEIMEQAKHLNFMPCDPETDAEREAVIFPAEDLGEDMSMNLVYRWIDGDANDDSSNDIDIDFLKEFADYRPDAVIATGSYNWRHESDTTATGAQNYHAFIEMINEKEAILRKAYFDAMSVELSTPGSDKVYSSGDFYMPESTFMMNKAAHDAISRPGNIGSDAQDASRRHKINPDGDQAQESMRLYHASGIGSDNINYRDDLHVTKPLKKEFASNGYAASLMAFFKRNGTYNRAKLAAALTGLRQSAFGNSWQPKGGNGDYMRLKNTCIDELEAFLANNGMFAKIKRELQQR